MNKRDRERLERLEKTVRNLLDATRELARDQDAHIYADGSFARLWKESTTPMNTRKINKLNKKLDVLCDYLEIDIIEIEPHISIKKRDKNAT